MGRPALRALIPTPDPHRHPFVGDAPSSHLCALIPPPCWAAPVPGGHGLQRPKPRRRVAPRLLPDALHRRGHSATGHHCLFLLRAAPCLFRLRALGSRCLSAAGCRCLFLLRALGSHHFSAAGRHCLFLHRALPLHCRR
ncbi:hypothetical protein E2562_004432 [Oryza meyeriana var. granulata]|uniref:Uncharacterized protein n=1 Tax=Oryza meyeriana var. granulata TaxID=110450 RepID=A0A6G1CZX6_9ORYZ|nr:hypothetical protein E2562_004432 [Oryza meyeriana var. granulata]